MATVKKIKSSSPLKKKGGNNKASGGKAIANEKNFFKTLAKNRQALRDYSIENPFEAGIVLMGSELKPVRAAQITLKGSYAFINSKRELVIKGMQIKSYLQASYQDHETTRIRKLLIKKRELLKLETTLKKGGFTLIPLEVYLKNQWVKIKIGLARGKKKADIRKEIKKKDVLREMERFHKKSRA